MDESLEFHDGYFYNGECSDWHDLVLTATPPVRHFQEHLRYDRRAAFSGDILCPTKRLEPVTIYQAPRHYSQQVSGHLAPIRFIGRYHWKQQCSSLWSYINTSTSELVCEVTNGEGCGYVITAGPHTGRLLLSLDEVQEIVEQDFH